MLETSSPTPSDSPGPDTRGPLRRRWWPTLVALILLGTILSTRSWLEFRPVEHSTLKYATVSESLNITKNLYHINATDVSGPVSDVHLISSSCARICPREWYQETTSGHPTMVRSRIAYTHPSPAGWGDRKRILTNMANLAAFLCADVGFPTPAHAFVKSHNAGKSTHPNFAWSDFIELRLDRDDSINLLPEQPPPDPPPTTTMTLHRIKTKTLDQIADHWALVQRITNRELERWKTTATTASTHPPPAANESFVWKVSMNYFPFQRHLVELMANQSQRLEQEERNALPALSDGIEEGCRYVTSQPPAKMKALVQQMIQSDPQLTESGPTTITTTVTTTTTTSSAQTSLARPISDIGQEVVHLDSQALNTSSTSLQELPIALRVGLHIRRGDLKDQCNSTVEKLQAYLNCSVVQPLLFQRQTTATASTTTDSTTTTTTASTSNRLATILFYSDEMDSTYRTRLAKMVETTLPSLRWLDLDAWVNYQLKLHQVPPWKKSNNYYVFRVLQVVLHELQAAFFLLRRRQSECADCEPVILDGA